MKKINLTDVKWKEFRIGDLFEIENTKPYHKNNLKLASQKGIQYITRTSFNNGVENIVEEDIAFTKNKKNSITLGAENADFFYHEQEYICGNKMYSIHNEYINKYSGKFLVSVFRKSIKNCGFGYGQGLTGTRFKKRKIMLPIDEKENPNWKFMEDYIKQETKIKAQKIISYYENKLNDILSDFDLEKFKTVKYKNKKWSIFSIGNLFDIKIGKTIDGNKIQDNLGNTPYVTRKTTDNGLENFIDGYDEIYLSKEVPVITIGNETAKPFVQTKPFYTGTKVNILKPKENINVNILKFICNALENSCDRYSYSFTINSTRLKKEKIILPVKNDDETQIDWEYMSNFIADIEKEKIEAILRYIYIYIINRVTLNLKELYSFKNIKWKEFFIEEIAEIKSGQDIYERERIDGFTPYITATANNNGIGYFISNVNKTYEKSCISVNRNGSVGYAFYHDYPALYGNDTRKLVPIIKNKYSSLFITNAITNQKEKYGYGYKMGTERLKRQKIMLPIDKNKNPDWNFMENYIKILEMEKIISIIKYYKI